LRATQGAGYLSYPEADFGFFFAPQGQHVAPMGRNLARRRGPEIWSKCGIKTPRKGVSLARFSKNSRICTPFQDALAVKISVGYLLYGLWSYGDFKLPVSGYWLPPNFQRPLAAKLCVRSL